MKKYFEGITLGKAYTYVFLQSGFLIRKKSVHTHTFLYFMIGVFFSFVIFKEKIHAYLG